MPQKLTIAVSQSYTLSTLSETLEALEETAKLAAKRNVHVLLFPEAYLGGYPRGCSFGSSIGSREAIGREQFLRHYNDAADLGDTPKGAGEDWVQRKLPTGKGKENRGDGTREALESVAGTTGVFLTVGVVERAGGSLYCSCVYVCPNEGCIGKRRKVMPTGTERLIWAQGSPSTLKAVTTTIAGVKLTLAAAICWENYMPLLRHSLYSQNVNLYLVPTADARETWLPLLQTIALEGRTFVLSANQCIRKNRLPRWLDGNEGSKKPTESIREAKSADINGEGGRVKGNSFQSRRRPSVITKTEDNHEITWPPCQSKARPDETQQKPGHPTLRQKSTVTISEDEHELCLPAPTSDASSSIPAPSSSSPGPVEDSPLACRGGSCIVGPNGKVLAGPLWEVEDGGLLVATVDFDECTRGKLDFDAAGSYSRNDAFKLTVEGLDLEPPD